MPCEPLSATYSTCVVGSKNKPTGFRKPALTPAPSWAKSVPVPLVPSPLVFLQAPASLSIRVTPDVALLMEARRTDPQAEDVRYTPKPRCGQAAEGATSARPRASAMRAKGGAPSTSDSSVRSPASVSTFAMPLRLLTRRSRLPSATYRSAGAVTESSFTS